MRYTSTHWGIYQLGVDAGDAADGVPHARPLAEDDDPSEIGLGLGEPDLEALRIRHPAVREGWLEHGPGGTAPGQRGSERMVEVDWDTALDLAARDIDRVRRDHGNRAIFAGSYGWSSAGRFHHGQSQVHRFMNCLGGYVRHVNTYSLGAAHALMPYIIGPMKDLMADHTTWEVMAGHTDLFVSFGGVPRKNTQVSPGGVRQHFTRGGLSDMRARGTKFVNFSPVRDNLEVPEAEWIQIRPNTDTAVMLALAHVLVTENRHDRAFLDRHCTGFAQVEAYLTGQAGTPPCTPDWAEAISGVPAARITSLAREMAGSRTMINMAWSLQRASHGEQPCWMLVTLAAILGQIGLPGGGFGFGYGTTNALGSPFPRTVGPTLDQGRNPVEDFIPVARIADMLLAPGGTFAYGGETHRYPNIRLVHWVGGNPFHHHQDLNRLERGWARPETIIVNEQYWTPTARRADIVFPASTALERNDIGFATREGHYVAMRQAVPPIAGARSDYEIFCGLAARLGITEAFTEGRDEVAWLRHMYEEARGAMAQTERPLPDFDRFWEQGLVQIPREPKPTVMLQAFRADPEGHALPTPSGRIELFCEKIAGFALPDCKGHACWLAPAEWLGAAAEDELHLLSDQPARRLHSQLDASAHSRAGKVDGREPVMINAADAAARGIADGDVVMLSNTRGAVYAAAQVSRDIMPGVVKLSTGAWYDPDGDGRDRHGNPNAVTLDRGTSSLTQGSSAQTCLVRLSGPVNAAPAVRAHEVPALRRL
ncbi:molybdopterin-dependent oxidoreductase [Roseovarius atlanticus]|uniref:molybdopterin-dependent oxidoreductase n=1 Tax=Roseovarius atlanticus TaxID=1641875 RepID=UPI001C95D1EF|nr:molybdopterin-dependent oxidoreductase [Roseovarius atlanticus]MBY5986437.1 molybdopterin-dependent oxidoreductase [Roseovarius atlanticus]MBY6125077.1 molybdopterin-dependent oxidoreductase [Roseovarius atlanticus]MBY6150462.1 molybdopterin-dependent oxidoreductase [Roseovarius atlanticus]